MTDLIEAVRAEHRRILELTDEVLARCGEGPDGERAPVKPIDALVALESRHESTEARFLWPVVRDTMREYAGLRETAQRQERQARRDLYRLHKVAGQPGSAGLAVRVARQIVTHVGLEESQILAALAGTLSPNDSVRIGRMYRDASKNAPTRPHPRLPAVPGLLSMVGPMSARMDRTRDLLKRR